MLCTLDKNSPATCDHREFDGDAIRCYGRALFEGHCVYRKEEYAPQNTVEAGEQQATGQGTPLLDNPSSAEMKLADDLQFGR